MSIGSISTYRNKKRACCPTLAASSILYTIFTPKWREDIDISVTLLKRLYGIYQRLTGHMDITLVSVKKRQRFFEVWFGRAVM